MNRNSVTTTVMKSPVRLAQEQPHFYRQHVATLLAIAALLTATLVQAQAPPMRVQPIVTVKPDLYLISGAGSNVAVRVTREGVIVVDTKNPGQEIYDATLAQIRSVSDQPVRYVIDTHYHLDHVGNNQRFVAAGAELIGQEKMKINLANYEPPEGTTMPALPSVTYQTKHVISLGGARVELLYLGRGHTAGDTIVYFPDLKTIATGDLMHLGSPLIDYRAGANLGAWLQTLDKILRLNFDTVIPGHGERALTKHDVKEYREKLATVLKRGRELQRQGVAKTKFLESLSLSDLGWNLNTEVMRRPHYLDGFFAEMYSDN